MKLMPERPLRYAMEQLTQVQALTLRGGSEALAEAEARMGEMEAFVAEAKRMGGGGLESYKAELFEFELAARRTAKLLEGARRAQWIRLRRIQATGETYTARGELRGCAARGTVNISA